MSDEYSPGEIGRGFERMHEDIDALRRALDTGLNKLTVTLTEQYLTKERYEADSRTLALAAVQTKERLDAQALEVVDLRGEATRRARERRNIWMGMAGIAIPSITALLIAFRAQSHVATSSCTPNPVSPTVVTCTFPSAK